MALLDECTVSEVVSSVGFSSAPISMPLELKNLEVPGAHQLVSQLSEFEHALEKLKTYLMEAIDTRIYLPSAFSGILKVVARSD